MKERISNIFADADDSDLYLTLGSLFLFIGCYMAYPPLAYAIIGCIFLYLAYIIANPRPIHTYREAE